MKNFDQISEGILQKAGRGIGKFAKGTWQNVIQPAAIEAGREIAGTLGQELSKAASNAIKTKFNPTRITPQSVPGAAAGIGSGTTSGAITAPVTTTSTPKLGATASTASGSMATPAIPAVTSGTGTPAATAPGISGKGSSSPGAMRTSTPKKPNVGVMIDPNTGQAVATSPTGASSPSTGSVAAPPAQQSTTATTATIAPKTPTPTLPPYPGPLPAPSSASSVPVKASSGINTEPKTFTTGLSQAPNVSASYKRAIEDIMKRDLNNRKLANIEKLAKMQEIKSKLKASDKTPEDKLVALKALKELEQLSREDFNQLDNVDVFFKLLQEEKYDDCMYMLDEWVAPLLAAVGRQAAIAGAAGAAGTAGSRVANKAIDKYELRKAQQQAHPQDVEDEETEDEEGCECEAGANTQISLKGKIEQLKKAIQILKSIGLLENKYIMNDMAEQTNVKEGAISRALGGAAIGSLVPGVGTLAGAGLGLGAGQVLGSIRKGITGPKPGEDAESKKKKKMKFDFKKADRNKNGKIEGWEKGLASKFTNKENTNISNFIKYISQKNYAEANKYLQEVVNSKLQARIKQALKQKLF